MSDHADLILHLRYQSSVICGKAADALEAQAAELATLRASTASVQADQRAELERLRAAVLWALGVGDDFPQRPEGAGLYWWRHELAKRAGIEWNGTAFVSAARNTLEKP